MLRVLKLIRHDGNHYLPGSVLPDLQEQEAQRLVRLGAAEVLPETTEPVPVEKPRRPASNLKKAKTEAKKPSASGAQKTEPKAKETGKEGIALPPGVDPKLAGGE